VPKAEENAPAGYSSMPTVPAPATPLVISVKAANPAKYVRTADFVDANGNTAKGEYRLVRDSQNRVVGYGNSTRWKSYAYDGTSKRISSITHAINGLTSTQSFRFDNAGRIVEKVYPASSQTPWSRAKDVYEYNDSASRVSVSRFAANGSKLSTSIFDLQAMTETFSSDTANYTFNYAFVALSSSADNGPIIFTAPSFLYSGGSSGNGSERPTYAVPPPQKCSFGATTRRHSCEWGDSKGKLGSEFSIVRFETLGEYPSYASFIHKSSRESTTARETLMLEENSYNSSWGAVKRIESSKGQTEWSSETVMVFASDPFNPVEATTTRSNRPKVVTKFTYFEG